MLPPFLRRVLTPERVHIVPLEPEFRFARQLILVPTRNHTDLLELTYTLEMPRGGLCIACPAPLLLGRPRAMPLVDNQDGYHPHPGSAGARDSEAEGKPF